MFPPPMQFLLMLFFSLASSDELDLIWTSSGCDYVPAEKIQECKRLVKDGKPFRRTTMREDISRRHDNADTAESASDHLVDPPLPAPAPVARDLAFGGRPTLDALISSGLAGNLGATGAGIGVGWVWESGSAKIAAGYMAGTRGRSNLPGSNGRDYSIATGEVELLFGDQEDGSLVAGFGGRIGFPNTPFAAIGYTVPTRSGAMSGIVHLGYRMATMNLSVSFSPGTPGVRSGLSR